MNSQIKVPVVRVAIPFIVGVIVAIKLSILSEVQCVTIFAALILLLLIYRFFFKVYFNKFRWIQGLLMSLLIGLLGFSYTNSRVEINRPTHFSHFINKESILKARIIEPIEEKEKSYKALVEVKIVNRGDSNYFTTGKGLVYFKKDSVVKELKYGDVILIKNNLQEIKPPANPGQFNYKSYLSNKQIFHQAYIKPGEWIKTDERSANLIYEKVYKIRQSIISMVKDKISGEDESAIATALLVGYKEELGDKIIQSFQSTGSFHVLAVSGLHVGIIYLIFNFLFRFLKRFKYGNVLYIAIQIMLLWFYAMLTGLTPSVSRAATMFTFIIVGQSLKRVTNIYGSILTSAFVLLIINPFLITHVGFQLSYAAVFGIVFLQPKLYALVSTRWWLVDKIWALTCVSIAAQLATAPISIYYFHQFPLYFFLSNIIVIPAVPIIIYLGFTFLIFEVLGMALISNFLALVLEYIISWLCRIVFILSDLPGALIDDIYISNIGVILLYMLILCLLIFIIYNRKLYLHLGLIFLIIFSLISLDRSYENQNNKEIVIFSVSKGSLICFIDGTKSTIIGDSSKVNDHKTLKYNVVGHLLAKGISSKEQKIYEFPKNLNQGELIIKGNYMKFYDKKIVYIDKKIELTEGVKKFKTDILVLSQNTKMSINQIKDIYDFKIIVFDKSNKFWNVKKWKEECLKIKMKYHDINTDGAFIQRIQ